MKRLLPLGFILFLLIGPRLAAAETEDGFVLLMDGKTFTGWKAATENPDTWKIEDGAFVTRGKRNHLFYVGAEKPFKNFELRVEVMTEPGANGGIYFHTRYQETDWPRAGFETQVNVSHSDWKKSGSLYDVANTGLVASADGKWWTQDILVVGNTVTVKIDGKTVVQYIEPPGAQPGATFSRKLGEGTFALQAHDPKSVVRYRNIRVKRLPDCAVACAWGGARPPGALIFVGGVPPLGEACAAKPEASGVSEPNHTPPSRAPLSRGDFRQCCLESPLSRGVARHAAPLRSEGGSAGVCCSILTELPQFSHPSY